MEPPFRPEFFARLDEEPDTLFYAMPRKVVHIDEAAIAAIQRFLPEVLPAAGVVLDLMSSWRSHWPEGFPKHRLVGLGLNAEEMADNPDLDAYVVHNVNETPRLPFEDATFDAVIMTVSIQYVTRPLELFQDVRRILRPDGPFVVIFSNRMFPYKAVAVWRMLDDRQHIDLVASYFHYAGGFRTVKAYDRTPQALLPGAEYTDPVYIVVGTKGEPDAAQT
ncbi:MAG: class I SAM-dependent methyltransferase [Candidatus Tectimicrobiota bacterium]